MKDEVREHLEDILSETFDIKEFTSGIRMNMIIKPPLSRIKKRPSTRPNDSWHVQPDD